MATIVRRRDERYLKIPVSSAKETTTNRFDTFMSIHCSIIIPHRNTPALLKRCLDSIPPREDIQIIVVDDASDDTVRIREFAESYAHAKFIYQKEHKGAGHARNIGVAHSEGQWILFADADDFFFEGFDKQIDRYLSSDADIVFFDVAYRYSDNLQPAPPRYPLISESIHRDDIEMLKWRVSVVWGKLYSGELIRANHIMFDETIINNDVIFAFKASFYAEKYLISPFILYCNTLCLNSLQFTLNKTRLDCSYSVHLHLNRLLHSIGKGKYQYNLFRIVLKYWNWFGFKAYISVFCKKYLPDTTMSMKAKDFILSCRQISAFLSKDEKEKRSKIKTI